jgi:hypothetical protein
MSIMEVQNYANTREVLAKMCREFYLAACFLSVEGRFPVDWLPVCRNVAWRSGCFAFALGYLHCRYSECTREVLHEMFCLEQIKISEFKTGKTRFFDNSILLRYLRTSGLCYHDSFVAVSYEGLRHDLKQAIKIAGLQKTGSHCFVTHLPRRLTATQMFHRGLSLNKIACELNHESCETTAKYIGGFKIT